MVVLGVLVAIVLPGCGGGSVSSRVGGLGWPASRASPSKFVGVASRGLGYELEAYSARTGAPIRQLGRFSWRTFTNNGLAISPNGRGVYFTLIPRHRSRPFALRLMRLDLVTRRRSFVTDGAQPALNESGTELAYATFPTGLAVRDLRTGRTRAIALSQLDNAANVEAGAIGWLSDGSDVAIVPSGTAWDLMGKPPKERWCGTSQKTGVIVFVHVPPPPAALDARCIRVPRALMGGRVVVAPDPASARSALVATTGASAGTLVEQISRSGAIEKVVSIPDSLPIAFDTSGDHLLYLKGHQTPTLMEATIRPGRVVNGPWRDRNIGVGAAAW